MGSGIAPRLTAREKPGESLRQDVREWISWGFGRVEDVVYIGLGILLTASAVVLLGAAALTFGRHLLAGTLPDTAVALLDQILLILIIVEILYTVQVSFREHVLTAEPFLIVGLIAVTRRLLVLTAEVAKLIELGDVTFRHAMIELGLLTFVIIALVASLVLLRKRRPEAVADRA